MSSQKKSTKGTLLGFFKKVDGPSPPAASAKSQGASKPLSTNPAYSSNPSQTKAREPTRSTPALPPSPPASASGGSVSPVAHSASSRASARSPSSPEVARLPNAFKTPLKPTAKSQGPVSVNPRSGLPTPPTSSPLASNDDDADEEDAMPSSSRRTFGTKKRVSYFESGSEGEDGSDFEVDESDASPPPRIASRQPPPTKRAKPSPAARTATPAKFAPRSNSAYTPTRPPFARASTSTTSAEKASPSLERSSPEGRNATGFDFLNDRRDMDGNRPGDPDFDPRTLLIPKGAWGTMTNFEKQYFEIKQWNMDTILMFQKGKFYEMFLEDSEIAHRELDLKLTDRGRMPMVGVPEASFDLFATKLLALGYKVGRVDQMETAVAKGMRTSDKKGGGSEIVRRELRHVMTTGTMIEGLEDDLANFCVAISEDVVHQGGEDFATFGVCMLDAATSEFTLAEWTDDRARSELETLLRSHRIKEIIHKKGQLSKDTQRIIKNCVGVDCRVTMLREGKEWLPADDTVSQVTELFSEQGIPESISSMLDKVEAVSALGGMFAYLTQLSLLQDLASSRNFHLLDERRTASGQPMKLDANTLSHLCVLQNEDGSDTGTLLRLLNRCVTPCGKRLFKLWLTHPLSDAASIEARLDAVDDLMGNINFEDAFAACKKFPDFERLIPKVYSGKIKPGEFTRLLTSLKKVTPFVDSLRSLSTDFTSALIKQSLDRIPDVASLAEELDSMFVAEEDGSFQPHPGVDEDFDAGQAQVEEVEAQLETELRRIRKMLGLGSQKSGGCNWKHRGTNEIYQIGVPTKTKVPNDWMQISSTASEKGYYNPVVKDLVLSLKEARETRLVALKNFHARLFEQFNLNAESYMSAVRLLAQVDCLLSLAQASYAMGEPTCRPTFVDSERALVDFEELRHPCIATTTDFIANDVKMGGDAAEVILLTGGNMAGKSTTARTSATGIILAQLGCRVPAKSARISPVDRICSRMGANDQIFRNSSTFMVEMQEASRIVKECTPRSLVIMDELGRGTSTFDGHAIAHAVLHHLIARTRCLCFFLTHYLQLAYDFQGYPRCSNKHMEVLVDDELREVVFTYRLTDGVAESSYGTQVAGLAGVPREICDRANDISLEFAEATKKQQAERTTSTVPMSSLSDFAYLFKIGQGKQGRYPQLASQLEVIRAQVERVNSSSTSKVADAEDVVMAEAGALDSSQFSDEYKRNAAVTQNSRRPGTEPRSYAGRKRQRPSEFARWDSSDDDDAEATNGCRTRSSPNLSSRDHLAGETLAPAHSMSSPPPPPTPNTRKAPRHALEERCAGRMNVSPVTSAGRGKDKAGRTSLFAGKQQQTVLALGQKLQVTCRDCGMSYDRSSGEDTALHLRHHEKVTRGVEWTNASVVGAGEELKCGDQELTLNAEIVTKALGKAVIGRSLGGGSAPLSSAKVNLDALLDNGSRSSGKISTRILRYPLVSTSTASTPRDQAINRKVTEVETTIDEALGAARLPDSVRNHCKLYLVVVCNRVASAAIVGPVPSGQARQVLYDDTASPATDLQVDEALFASSIPLAAESTPPIGIHRIYTLPSLRGNGIAHHLLDVVLGNAIYGMSTDRLLKEQRGAGIGDQEGRSGLVAFSQPTQAGRRLAEGWLRKRGADPIKPGLVVFQE